MTEKLRESEQSSQRNGIRFDLPSAQIIYSLNSLLEYNPDEFLRQVSLASADLPNDYPISALACSFVARSYSFPQETEVQDTTHYELAIDLVLRQPQKITETTAETIATLLQNKQGVYRTLPNGKQQVRLPILNSQSVFFGEPVNDGPFVVLDLGHNDPKQGLAFLKTLPASAEGPVEKRIAELEEIERNGELSPLIRLRLTSNDIYDDYIDRNDHRPIQGLLGTVKVDSSTFTAFLKTSEIVIKAVCSALDGEKKRTPVTIPLIYSKNRVYPTSPEQKRLMILKEKMSGLTPKQISLFLEFLRLHIRIEQLTNDGLSPELPRVKDLFDKEKKACLEAGIPPDRLTLPP